MMIFLEECTMLDRCAVWFSVSGGWTLVIVLAFASGGVLLIGNL